MDKSSENAARNGIKSLNPPGDLNWRHAQTIIENFSKIQHPWKPDQKEILYMLDGIIHNLPADAIARKIHRSPAWIRVMACSLLAFHQQDEIHPVLPVELAEKLLVGINQLDFIHCLFTHWGNLLPERKALFQWVLFNQPSCHNDRVSQIMRREHLHWYSQNKEARKKRKFKDDQWRSTGLSAETFVRLNQINETFKELKRDLRENDIEVSTARDLLERLNLILISYNLIRDKLVKLL